MKLKFKTALSNIGKNEKPCYRAIVCHNGTVEAKYVAEKAAKAAGVAANVAKFYLEKFLRHAVDALVGGCRVEAEDLFRAMLSVTGTFAAADAAWNSAKNALSPNFAAKGIVKDAFAGAEAENTTKGAKVQISRVLDVLAHIPDVLTVGQKALLSGQGMLVDTEAEDEGVWLENAEGVNVAAGTIVNRTDTTLDCTFAEWPEPGAYRICVASRGGLGERYGVAVAKRQIEVAAGE